MATLAERLLEHGIRARHYRDGGQKLLCPPCSRDRKKSNDRCLSLTIEGERAVWNCHHCAWSGTVSERDNERPAARRRPAPIRPAAAPGDLSPAELHWLKDRGISETTARRNRVGAARAYIPALGREADCIAFPYFRDGQLINIKFRALEQKAFTQVKGAETILYSLDDIADSKTAIIVEGEPDKLALEEAGFCNVVSVPDGAPAQVKAGGRTRTTTNSRSLPTVPMRSTGSIRSSWPAMTTHQVARSPRSWPAVSARNAAGGCAGPTAATRRARTPTRRCCGKAPKCCGSASTSPSPIRSAACTARMISSTPPLASIATGAGAGFQPAGRRLTSS